MGWRATTDANGRFALSRLPRQRVDLETLNMPAGDEYPVGWWATTDANGRFALSRLPRQRTTSSAVGHMTHLVELPADANQLDINLGGGATIKGSLLFGDGTPVDGMVALRFVSNGPWNDTVGWHPLGKL